MFYQRSRRACVPRWLMSIHLPLFIRFWCRGVTSSRCADFSARLPVGSHHLTATGSAIATGSDRGSLGSASWLVHTTSQRLAVTSPRRAGAPRPQLSGTHPAPGFHPSQHGHWCPSMLNWLAFWMVLTLQRPWQPVWYCWLILSSLSPFFIE